MFDMNVRPNNISKNKCHFIISQLCHNESFVMRRTGEWLVDYENVYFWKIKKTDIGIVNY